MEYGLIQSHQQVDSSQKIDEYDEETQAALRKIIHEQQIKVRYHVNHSKNPVDHLTITCRMSKSMDLKGVLHYYDLHELRRMNANSFDHLHHPRA